MPRKYRPPAARRRKSKRQAPVYVEPVPDRSEASAPEDGAAGLDLDELADEPAIAVPERSPLAVKPPEPDRATGATTKHIARDYSYVRAEVRRIVFVAGFLIIALVITALLRN